MENEKQSKVCKVCGVLKERIAAGTFGLFNPKNKKDKRWVDADGRQWMGHTCPPCHANKCKERQRKKHAREEAQ